MVNATKRVMLAPKVHYELRVYLANNNIQTFSEGIKILLENERK